MRAAPLLTGALLVAVGVALALAQIMAQPKVPAPFPFPQGKDSPGVVTFSHPQHVQSGADKCTLCHVKVFKMKRGQTGPLTMAKMKAGEQCGTCHNGKTEIAGKTVFSVENKDKCETCHKKS